MILGILHITPKVVDTFLKRYLKKQGMASESVKLF